MPLAPYFKTIRVPLFQEGIWIVPNQISDSMISFSMYGDLVDGVVAESISLRAIDQKGFSDFITEEAFGFLFQNEVEVKYNIHEWISVKDMIQNLRNFANSSKTLKDLLEELEKDPEKIIPAEIDGELFFRGIEQSADYVEVKLYTHPPEEPTKVLQGHLQQTKLQKYFAKNNFLALMGFAYIRSNEKDVPISFELSELKGYGLTAGWAISLTFISKETLRDGLNANQRAGQIFDAVNGNLDLISERLGLKAKHLFFQHTTNFVKVHAMGSVIEKYYLQVEALSKKVEDLSQKAAVLAKEKDELAKEKDELAKEKDKLARQVESYKRKLEEKGEKI